MRVVKLPRVKGVGIGPRTETCENWGGPIGMVLYLHQGNIYIKKNLRAWRDQKCIRLVGAKTPVTCAGRQTAPSEGRRYRAENGNLHKKSKGIKRKLRVWRGQKCVCLVGAKTPLTCGDRQTTPSHGSRCRAENLNLRKLGWNYRHGTVFASRQYLQ